MIVSSIEPLLKKILWYVETRFNLLFWGRQGHSNHVTEWLILYHALGNSVIFHNHFIIESVGMWILLIIIFNILWLILLLAWRGLYFDSDQVILLLDVILLFLSRLRLLIRPFILTKPLYKVLWTCDVNHLLQVLLNHVLVLGVSFRKVEHVQDKVELRHYVV